jgi:hypothetical protein
MKKIFFLVVLSCFLQAPFSFAETKKVDCTTSPDFETNTCDVCYQETYSKTKAQEGWSSTITDIIIPWEHGGGELDEIIYDNEQKYPEIKTTLTLKTTAEKAEELWKNHEALIWKPFDDHKEFVVKPGEQVGLYRLSTGQSITMNDIVDDSSFIITTPLTVGSFNAATNEETEPKVRNICIRWAFTSEIVWENTSTSEKTETSATDTITQTETDMETVTLDSAGPEPIATAEQTSAKSGPEVWVSLLLAFIFASAWNAWKKSQTV